MTLREVNSFAQVCTACKLSHCFSSTVSFQAFFSQPTRFTSPKYPYPLQTATLALTSGTREELNTGSTLAERPKVLSPPIRKNMPFQKLQSKKKVGEEGNFVPLDLTNVLVSATFFVMP